MRCEQVRAGVEEEGTAELSAPVCEHLASCPACRVYAQDWRLVRVGLQALAEEPGPEVSVGFATRVIRRLEEATDSVTSRDLFLERVGRRVVYGTLLLALMMLLALLLPSSGPLRGPATAELYLAQADAITVESDPIFANDFPDAGDAVPVKSTDEGEKGQK